LIEQQIKTANDLNTPIHSIVYGDKPEANMAGQVQEACIAAATRAPVGKAPRGMFRMRSG
jgi:hypothetical protein